jgi:hypothetical protein
VKDAAMTIPAATRPTPGWFTVEDCRVEDFRAIVETTTDLADYPYADEPRENVLVYGLRLRDHIATPEGRREVQADWPARSPTGQGFSSSPAPSPTPASSTAPPPSSRR